MTSLVGKYVIYSGMEHYRTGQVVGELSDAVLIQFEASGNAAEVVLPQEVIAIERLSEEIYGDIPAWGLFDSRELLDAYVDWLNGGGRPTVVRLVREEE